MHTVPLPRPLGRIAFSCFSLVLLVALSRCTDQVEATRRYTKVTPVYETTEALRQAVSVMPARAIEGTGKIYAHNGYLFLNQPSEGIHIIDNSDPANPRTISFVNIPGNFDLAAQGDILYADSYIDLLALDISDPQNVTVTKRVENVFPRYNSYGFYPDDERGIVTSWIEEEVVEVYEGDLSNYNPYGVHSGAFFFEDGLLMNSTAQADFRSSADVPVLNQSSEVVGKAGSLARFAASNGHLYAVDDQNMQVFDITQSADPVPGNELTIGFLIETIFPYKDKLFIGSQSEMFIYDNANPANPAFVSSFSRATSCDPVVANDTLAYVTLRSGNTCQGTQNQLDVLDIRDVYNPWLMMSYQMENPHGLGIDANVLFLAEGEHGLKVFDTSDSYAIDQHLLAHFEDIHAYDVIPLNGVLIVIADDGIYQYDYADLNDIRLLSKLTVAAV